MTEKRYEILDFLPTYGLMYVPVAQNGDLFYSEGFAVRFYKTDGTEWVANFQLGWTRFRKVVEFDDHQNLVVIAGGTCYIMNPDSTIPIEVFGVGYSEMFKASNARIVLQDQTDFTIIEKDGKHWHTERISWDGFAESNVENNLIWGLAFNPVCDSDDWIAFKYDLDTKILTGGSYYSFKKKKPWWKVW